MPTLRFLNPTLHSQFVRLLRERGFAGTVGADGSMHCSDDQWPQVNELAHRVRDTCFPWYFSWFETRQSTREFEEYLLNQGFRFELEDHGVRLIFLLPKSDEGKYDFGGADPPTHLNCSFCGKAYTEVQRFFASETAAICDACVSWLHSKVQDKSDGERDA